MVNEPRVDVIDEPRVDVTYLPRVDVVDEPRVDVAYRPRVDFPGLFLPHFPLVIPKLVVCSPVS